MRRSETALMKAADLLARQSQSSNNLRRKLLAKKFKETEIDDAIAKLTEKKFINDAETCANQFESLYAAETLSVKQIYYKLLQRGFDSDTIKNVIPNDTYDHEYNAATKLVDKKFSGSTVALDFKFKNKIRQYLGSKGFSSDIINTVTDEFLNSYGN